MIIKPTFKKDELGRIDPVYFQNVNGAVWSIENLIWERENLLIGDELRIIVNFNFCRYSIIKYLFESQDFKERENEKQNEMVFMIKSTYIVVYFTRNKRTIFCDYGKKFGQDFKSWKISQELEEVDQARRATATQDAKYYYWQTIKENVVHGHNIAKLRYPQATGRELNYLTKAKNICSQFSFAMRGEYVNVHSYDIAKSYPARLYRKHSPSGPGKYFPAGAKVPPRYWYVRKFHLLRWERKSLDFLGLDEYNGTQPIIYLTLEEVDLLQKYYVGKWKELDGFMYKMRFGAFDKFIERFLFNHANDQKHIGKYYKRLCNLLIGSFGARDHAEEKYTMKDGILSVELEAGDPPERYLPLYLYVVGAAKKAIADVVAPNSKHCIYCNTDGAFFTKPPLVFQVAATFDIGYVEQRHIYNRVAIKELNDYYAEYIDEDGVIRHDLALGGRSKPPEDLTYTQYVTGDFESLGIGIEKSTGKYFYRIIHESPL